MNKLNGAIVAIESNDYMSIVDVLVGRDTLTATLLETLASAGYYLAVGAYVSLLFKETEVSLAKNLTGELSLRNRIDVKVTSIHRGAILSAVSLDYQGEILKSVITTRAVNRLNLMVGDSVEALIKANEVMVSHDV